MTLVVRGLRVGHHGIHGLSLEVESGPSLFEVPLTAGATSLSYIVHKGDDKDLPADQSLDLKANGYEVWMMNGQEKYLLPQPAGSAAPTVARAGGSSPTCPR